MAFTSLRASKTPLALGLALAFTSSAQAAEFDFGEMLLTIDTTITAATSIRVEDRDLNLIGKANQAQFDFTGYSALGNDIYINADIWAAETGAYSTNNDLGNLMWDPGKAFSTQLSVSHDIDINMGNYGVFSRVFYFKDFANSNDANAWDRPISGADIDLCATSQAEEYLCQDFRVLDAFIYWDTQIGDKPLSIRVGDQVVSWGESTFIQHGINTTNAVDITRARSAGAELKEIFIPVGMVYADLGLTDALSVSGYYQYDWEKSRLPVAGSYFASNDWAGDGGQASLIQLGFAGNPDIDLDHLLAELNGMGAMLRAGVDPSALSAAYLAYPTKVALRAKGNDAHVEPDDKGGQYGLRLTYYAEALNETEFGLYHINYHSTRPLISGYASDFSAAGIGSDLMYLAANTITADNVTNLNAFAEAEFTYPEDIKLYGASFNTNIGTTAVAGEIAYRQDEPLQIDDVELLYQAMPEQLANAGLRPDLAGISQMNNIGRGVGLGERAEGMLFSDTMQMQMTVTHIFGPAFGADNFVMLGELAYVDVMDMPDPDLIRLNAPGTGRTPSLEPTPSGNLRQGLHLGLSDGPETNPFATATSWGYRLLAVADYNNVYSGVNLRVRGTFAHDVDGTTPDPLFLFIEERKQATVAATFTYLNKLSATASYNSYWGGIGTTNELADRDYVSFNVKYSF